jgi:hypothetical protein
MTASPMTAIIDICRMTEPPFLQGRNGHDVA